MWGSFNSCYCNVGNIQSWEMERCVRYHIIPTVATEQAIIGMAKCLETREVIDVSINDNHQNSPKEQRKASNRYINYFITTNYKITKNQNL